MWVFIVIVVASFASMCYAARRQEDINSVWYNLYDTRNRFILQLLLSRPLDGQRKAIIHCSVLTALVIVQPLLLVLKIDAVWPNMPWSVAFAPLLLSFCIFGCAPLMKWTLVAVDYIGTWVGYQHKRTTQ